jgi:hypothetical protein
MMRPYFQLPLSGSLEPNLVWGYDPGGKDSTFNSLSRDHNSDISWNPRRPSAFNSLSRDHKDRGLWEAIQSGTAFNSLSRDHGRGPELARTSESRNFQLPLSGSQQ